MARACPVATLKLIDFEMRSLHPLQTTPRTGQSSPSDIDLARLPALPQQHLLCHSSWSLYHGILLGHLGPQQHLLRHSSWSLYHGILLQATYTNTCGLLTTSTYLDTSCVLTQGQLQFS
ncbi:hypothetical protein TcasGA2_TC031785 [Tribolium castaneum]|uniref:Uncharacterized protein n=1 Tax=Tribolium castaneum TaxID=7070 RepID=A0A139WA05_TRICA|nr:hypothetical protein TcasGA2_TC031785 [Tribolium castaneum]